jgi:cyanophycinase
MSAESADHTEAGARGYVVAIGGAEDKAGDRDILRRFARLCGGRRARIAILPTASQLDDTGHRYARLFRELDVREAYTVRLESRADCDRRDRLEDLERADGIFITGGNQLRLSTTLGGTAADAALRSLYAAGRHVAGTSAGAAYLCQHMIAFGDEGPTPRAGAVQVVAGLGLTRRVIIDQHFRQRDRIGRMLTALAYNPYPIGLGLDEDTAAFLSPENVVEVEGSGLLTVIDAHDVEFDSIADAEKGAVVSLINVRLHLLGRGATYNLLTREATAPADAEA